MDLSYGLEAVIRQQKGGDMAVVSRAISMLIARIAATGQYYGAANVDAVVDSFATEAKAYAVDLLEIKAELDAGKK
jgi:hypothetical protein